jgi:phosphohistidine phosphatase
LLQLFIIRHAKSSWDNPALRDFHRPLNDRGLSVAPRMSKFMQQFTPSPDLLISSPARRAIDTAAFFAEAYQVPFADIVQEPALYEASALEIMRVISQLPETARVVFLFGHNPGLTEFVNQFTNQPFINIPTCGVVLLESTAPNWRALYEENTKLKQNWFPKTSLQ